MYSLPSPTSPSVCVCVSLSLSLFFFFFFFLTRKVMHVVSKLCLHKMGSARFNSVASADKQ